MPIRFRCAYCQQLMGIGRRKVGSIVRCPRCAGEVIVPSMLDLPAGEGEERINDLLESEDFGKELAAADMARGAPRDAPRQAPGFGASALSVAEPPRRQEHTDHSVAHDLRRRGLFLPTPMLIAGAALLIACFAVMFGLGCVIGRWIGP